MFNIYVCLSSYFSKYKVIEIFFILLILTTTRVVLKMKCVAYLAHLQGGQMVSITLRSLEKKSLDFILMEYGKFKRKENYKYLFVL